MKKSKLILIVWLSLILVGFSYGQTEDLNNPRNIYSEIVETVSSTPQAFTGTWVGLGSKIDVRGFVYYSIYMEITKNDSVNMRMRIVALHTSGGTEHTEMILTVNSTVITASPEYIELTDNTDQNIKLNFLPRRGSRYIQIQIEAGTVGASAGTVDSCTITKG